MSVEFEDFNEADISTAKVQNDNDEADTSTAQAQRDNIDEANTSTAIDQRGSFKSGAKQSSSASIKTAVEGDSSSIFDDLPERINSYLHAFWLNYCLFVSRVAWIIGLVYNFIVFAINNPQGARQVIGLAIPAMWADLKLSWALHEHGFFTLAFIYNYWVTPTPAKKKPAGSKATDRSKNSDVATAKKKL